MKKSDLLNYVGRYHLAGATTSVKWVAKDGGIETEFITDDQNVIGHVKADNLDLGNNELGVYATPALVKMLSAVGDDLFVNSLVISILAFQSGVFLRSGTCLITDKSANINVISISLSLTPILTAVPSTSLTLTLRSSPTADNIFTNCGVA